VGVNSLQCTRTAHACAAPILQIALYWAFTGHATVKQQFAGTESYNT